MRHKYILLESTPLIGRLRSLIPGKYQQSSALLHMQVQRQLRPAGTGGMESLKILVMQSHVIYILTISLFWT